MVGLLKRSPVASKALFMEFKPAERFKWSTIRMVSDFQTNQNVVWALPHPNAESFLR
jgi:hypothetical protein